MDANLRVIFVNIILRQGLKKCMSQIAAGYVVSSLMLQQAGRLALARSSSKLWQMLRKSAPEAQFEFSESGYAVAVAYLEEQGVALPCRLPGDLAASPLETEYAYLLARTLTIPLPCLTHSQP